MRRLLFLLLQLYWFIFRPIVPGARGLVLRPGGGGSEAMEVLLVRLTYATGWHLPGGGVKRGESFREAFVRELAEECGLEAKKAELFGLFFSDRYGKSDHVGVFVTTDFHEIPGARRDPEIAEVAFFSLERLPAEVTPATRRRIDDYRRGHAGSDRW